MDFQIKSYAYSQYGCRYSLDLNIQKKGIIRSDYHPHHKGSCRLATYIQTNIYKVNIVAAILVNTKIL